MSYQIPRPTGQLKSNVLSIIKSKAVKLKAHDSFDKEQELVPDQLLEKKQETEELKLLEQQLRYKEGVNGFLVRKYTDGTAFGVAKENQYDNSPTRLAAGISYEYHVYYPQNPHDKFPLAEHRHIVTPKLIDHKTGDHYYYHFPIRKYLHNNIGFYKIDYSNELISLSGKPVAPPDYPNNDNRLFYALNVLADHITNQQGTLDKYTYSVLKANKFLTPEGKLNLDVKTEVMVEKYFLKMNPQLKPTAMEYLSKEFGQPDTTAVEPVVVEPLKADPTEPSDVTTSPVIVEPESVKSSTDSDNEELERLKKEATINKNAAFRYQIPLKKKLAKVSKDMKFDEKIDAWKAAGVNFYEVVQNGERKLGPVYIGFGHKNVAMVYLSKLWFGMREKQLENIISDNRLELCKSINILLTVVKSHAYINKLKELGLEPMLKLKETPDNLFETLKPSNFTVTKL